MRPIDADALKADLHMVAGNNKSNKIDVREVIERIDLMRTLDVKPVVHAHWTHDDDPVVKCSQCGNFLDMWGVNDGRGDANFCPHCGARMDEEEEK